MIQHKIRNGTMRETAAENAESVEAELRGDLPLQMRKKLKKETLSARSAVSFRFPSASKSAQGFTLIEIMMGLLIITVAFASLGAVFSSIGRAILVNKNKTIATNLAQEKIESLKDLSYYRLLVTTASTYDTNFSPVLGPYDRGTTESYYPEETLVVGERTFKRRVYVEFVKDVGGDFYGQPWSANDTGIKRITVYVVWQDGEDWKKVEMTNLRNNPNREQVDYTFTGKVTSGTTGNPIYNAYVDTVENPSYFARTDASGNYSFKVSPGTYTLRASATGYFTATSTPYTVNTGDTGSSAQDFALTLKALGSATGYAYIRNHLIITQVVAATEPVGVAGEIEWVELYNPTTYNILIASRPSSTSDWNVFFVSVAFIDQNNTEPTAGNNAKWLMGMPGGTASVFKGFRSTSVFWTAETTTISVPSNSFFLISNRSTITLPTPIGFFNRIADAYYEGQQSCGSDCHQIDNSNKGGIRVTGVGGYSYNNRTDWHDGFAWTNDAASNDCASTFLAREGGAKCYEYFNLSNLEGRILYRYFVVSTNPVTTGGLSRIPDNVINRRGSSPYAANCFDRNITADGLYAYYSDWYYPPLTLASWEQIAAEYPVENVDSSLPCYSGTPAAGASVSVDDGMSAVAYVQTYGSFTVTNIATGTWNVTVASGNYIREISSLTITATILSTSILNASTDPKWEFAASTWGPIALTTSSIYGYISGIVYNVGARVQGADVATSGASAVTDSQGRYRLKVNASQSPFSVQASKSGLSTEVLGSIGVNVGVNISTVDFNLTGAGSVKGFVTTNGTASGKLPGIPVVAVNTASSTLGSAITDANGIFTIPSVTTGGAIVSLQLEAGETSDRNWVGTVVSVSTGLWIGTFTVTNAFGKIIGSVGTGSSTSPITTGVLLVASTYQITADLPPELNNSLRTGTSYHYAVSSDALGRYTLPLRGNASYYLYGWYTTSLSVTSSSAPRRFGGRIWVAPGGSVTKDISW